MGCVLLFFSGVLVFEWGGVCWLLVGIAVYRFFKMQQHHQPTPAKPNKNRTNVGTPSTQSNHSPTHLVCGVIPRRRPRPAAAIPPRARAVGRRAAASPTQGPAAHPARAVAAGAS